MPTQCKICADVRKKTVTCLNCETVVCTGCMQRIMLQSPIFKFACTSCNHDMSYEYIHPHFSKRFWKQEYREYVCQEIMRIEANRLPATMSFVAQKHRARDIKSQIRALKGQYRDLSSQKAQIRAKICELHQKMKRCDTSTHLRYTHCCNAECRAYVSDNEPTCVVCNTTTCSGCHGRILEGVPHLCDESAVLSISTIQKECRECPTCRVHIQKIDGCDQMFCTLCKSPFSWTTGQIITGPFHNPHLAIQERGLGEECGGGLPVRHEVSLFLASKCPPVISRWLMDIYDMLVRFRRIELNKLRNSRIDFNTHLKSRIAIIEHANTVDPAESTCGKKWYRVEQKIRLNMAMCDIMASYLCNMEGFYQKACVDKQCTSTLRVHRALVEPILNLTGCYIDFFTRVYERYSSSCLFIVKQLIKHVQAFPSSGPSYTSIESSDMDSFWD